jgi:N-acetylglutamate synthase/N-acetylornithine aminotransferase
MSDLFAKSEPGVARTYAAILKAVEKFGPIKTDGKKTSIHLVAKTGFAGVHPRKSAILLNIRSDAPIKSKRIRKVEKVSANRYHNEILIDSPSEVDAEVIGWLKAAHALSVG